MRSRPIVPSDFTRRLRSFAGGPEGDPVSGEPAFSEEPEGFYE